VRVRERAIARDAKSEKEKHQMTKGPGVVEMTEIARTGEKRRKSARLRKKRKRRRDMGGSCSARWRMA
jgi:hypothetical protein